MGNPDRPHSSQTHAKTQIEKWTPQASLAIVYKKMKAGFQQQH
jgi:hypothetical protein